MRTLKLLSITLQLILHIFQSNQQEIQIPFCSLKFKSLECYSFNSFDQLDFTNLNQQVDYIKFEPIRPIELNNKLNLKTLSKNQTNRLIFKNLLGFDSTSNLFQEIESTSLSIEIDSAEWIFSNLNGCNQSLTDNKHFIFENLTLYQFKISNPKFKINLCPLIFRNSQINKFIINSIQPLNYAAISDDTTGLNITINELYLQFGYSMQFTILDRLVLNENLFKQLRLIEINQCNVRQIQPLDWLPNLNELRLIKFDLKKLFSNGTQWINSLNSYTPDEPFWLTFSLSIVYENEFGDDEFCYFSSFPHNNSIIPVFYFESTDFNFAQLSDILPCSCTVYWFYKQTYKRLKQLANSTSYSSYLPTFCFDLDQSLIEEQFNYCQNDNRARDCNQTNYLTTIPTTTSIGSSQTACDYCTCTFGSLNLIQCTNNTITSIPYFNSSIQFDYVSLIGSSIQKLDNFKNLSLSENASLVVSNINEFQTDVFTSLIYEKQFSLIVFNSSLNSLFVREIFKDLNITSLEFKNCLIPESLLTSGFLGSRIKVLTFSDPAPGSFSPHFKRIFTFNQIYINKLEIKNAYDTFKQTSGQFGIDFLLLNERMFEHLEEINIVNTYLDYIESNVFTYLNNLKIIRLENVNLKNVILFYFLQFSFRPEQTEIDFSNENENWLANPRLSRVYLGREFLSDSKFEFQDEFICYFAGLNVNKLVFIYDSIDYFVISNFECTCTIYLIYSRIDNLQDFLLNDYDARYVPECVKSLGTNANIKAKLDSCLNGTDLNEKCKYSHITMPLIETTVTTSHFESTSLIHASSTSQSITIDNKDSYGSILISLLVITCLIFVAIIAGFVYYIKSNKLRKVSNEFELKTSVKF